jgi:hypothetical protein
VVLHVKYPGSVGSSMDMTVPRYAQKISLYTAGAKLGCLLGGSEDCASPQPRSGQRSGVCLGRGFDVRLCT